MKKIVLHLLFLFAIFNSYAQNKLYLKSLNPAAIPTQIDTITFDNDISIPSVKKLFKNFQVKYVAKAFPTSSKPKNQLVYEVHCNGNADHLVDSLKRKYTSYFYDIEAFDDPVLLYTPNDFHLQDGIVEDYALNLIRAQEAWDITKGSSSTLIGIIDNGFMVTHEDLQNQIVQVLSNSPNLHGTFVAGCAAAQTDNSIGKSGVGFNCKLIISNQTTINSMLLASQNGAHVINCSWFNSCSYIQTQQDIIDEIYENGTVIVVAAANGTNPDGTKHPASCGNGNGYVYPASYNHVISVTSVGPNDSHIGPDGSIHTHNDKVDIAAPGYNVLSTITWDPWYATSTGTSFASPIVAGVVGLIVSVNPDLNPDEVECILKSTSEDIYQIPSNQQFMGLLGTGRVDAFRAVQKAQQMIVPSTITTGMVYHWNGCKHPTLNKNITIESGGLLVVDSDASLQLASGFTITVNGTGEILFKSGSNVCIEGNIVLNSANSKITIEENVNIGIASKWNITSSSCKSFCQIQQMLGTNGSQNNIEKTFIVSAGNDIIACAPINNFPIGPTSTFTGTFNWTLGDGSSASGLLNNTSLKNPTVTSTISANTTFRLSYSEAGCTDYDEMTVFINLTTPILSTLLPNGHFESPSINEFEIYQADESQVLFVYPWMNELDFCYNNPNDEGCNGTYLWDFRNVSNKALPSKNLFPAPESGCQGADFPLSTLKNNYFISKTNQNITLDVNNNSLPEVYLMEAYVKSNTDATVETRLMNDVEIFKSSIPSIDIRTWRTDKILNLVANQWKPVSTCFSVDNSYFDQNGVNGRKLVNSGIRVLPIPGISELKVDRFLVRKISEVEFSPGVFYDVKPFVIDPLAPLITEGGSSYYERSLTSSDITSDAPGNFVYHLCQKLNYGSLGADNSRIARYKLDVSDATSNPDGNFNLSCVMLLQPFVHLDIHGDVFTLKPNAKLTLGHSAELFFKSGSYDVGNARTTADADGSTFRYEGGEIEFAANSSCIGIQNGSIEIGQGAKLDINTGFLAIRSTGYLYMESNSTLSFDYHGRLYFDPGVKLRVSSTRKLIFNKNSAIDFFEAPSSDLLKVVLNGGKLETYWEQGNPSYSKFEAWHTFNHVINYSSNIYSISPLKIYGETVTVTSDADLSSYTSSLIGGSGITTFSTGKGIIVGSSKSVIIQPSSTLEIKASFLAKMFSNTTLKQGSILRIKSGQKFIIESGSTFTLEGNAQVIVESGAYYCIHPSANVTGTITIQSGAIQAGDCCPEIVVNFGKTTACAGSQSSFWNLSSWQANTFEWRVNGVVKSTSSHMNYVFPAPGTYTVVLKAGNGNLCAAKQEQIIVPQIAGPITGLTSVPQGSQGVSYSINGTSGATYNWWINGEATVASGQGSNSITSNFGTSFQSIHVGVNYNGCYNESALTLTPVPLPQNNNCSVQASYGYSTPCVNQYTSFWNLSSWQANTFEWRVNGNVVSTQNWMGYTFTSPGTYTVQLRVGVNGLCNTDSRQIVIGDIAGPISGSPTVIKGQSGYVYTIPATSGASYNWWLNSDGQITSGQGTNTVTITAGHWFSSSNINVGVNANGCYRQTQLFLTATNASRLGDINDMNQTLMEVFPNPFSNETTIRIKGENISGLRIVDLNGSIRYENYSLTGEDVFNLGYEYPSGMYMVQLLTNDGMKVFKLVKTK